MINILYTLADMDGKWRPIIALYRDEKAKRGEDAKVPRKIPSCTRGLPYHSMMPWHA